MGKLDEDMVLTPPNDNIVCMLCTYSEPDLVIDGEVLLKGYQSGRCLKFRIKPPGILFDDDECPEFKADW